MLVPRAGTGAPRTTSEESHALSLHWVTALMSPSFVLPFPGGLSARLWTSSAPFSQSAAFGYFPESVSFPSCPSSKPPPPPPVLLRSTLEPAAAQTEPGAGQRGCDPSWGGGMATALAPKTIGGAWHLSQGSGTMDRWMVRGHENALD